MINQLSLPLLKLESQEQLDHSLELKRELVLSEPEEKGTPVQARPLARIPRQEQTDSGITIQIEPKQSLQAEAELRDKEQMVILQSRMAIMGEMIANLAHEWRQPLNVLGLFAQDLELSYKAGNLTAEYLENRVTQILLCINQMSKKLDCLNDFSKAEGEKKIFQIHEPIRWALSILDATLKAWKIDVSLNAASLPVITGYPTEMAHVFLSIIANARDALVERGVPNPKVTIATSMEGARTLVTITDNAGGIADDIAGAIFAPDFSTKSAGNGLGLHLSKAIIESMNGSLSVENVAGGAQFRIVL